jgi:uncharacterized protein (DUF1501 family)
MLNILSPPRQCRLTVSRRDVLQIGALTCCGLTLPHLLRQQAAAGMSGRQKSVILIWLRGGASHIDSFDMKPEAPAEIRGEFQPIPTNVPGIDICEHLPLTAQIMDKLAVIRGIKSNDLGDHTPHYILTGNPERDKRPVFGAVVSHLKPRTDGQLPYVSLMYRPPGLYDNEGPAFLSQGCRPFAPRGAALDNLSLSIARDRLSERRDLLTKFDTLRREIDTRGQFEGIDVFTQRAIDLVTSPNARDAFYFNGESDETIARYGKYCEDFLVARRLVEAGVNVVTLKVGDWDTHEHNFRDMRQQLPLLDRGYHALISDLYDRGLENDVVVVLWGEFGRGPRIDRSRMDGRDHWPEAGAAVIAGGGFRVGHPIGETDAHAARHKGPPYTPGHIMANLYRHLGIDPSQSLLDHSQRPVLLVDDHQGVAEL